MSSLSEGGRDIAWRGRERVLYVVTLGFNPSKAVGAVTDASREGGDLLIVVRRDPVLAARRALQEVLNLAESLGVRVDVLEVDPSNWREVARISAAMRGYGEIHIRIGGGLRIPQAFTLLAAIDNLKRVKELMVHDHDTGDEVLIPTWLPKLLSSPEKGGKLRVLKALAFPQPASKTPDEIASETGLSIGTVMKYVQFLRRAGLVKRVMPDKYRASSEGLRFVKAYFATGS